MEGLTLDRDATREDAAEHDTEYTEDTRDDAICPTCGKVYSEDSDLWVCCDECVRWYDFKCTKLRSRSRLPDSYVCDLCK